MAPFADLLWMETATANLHEAREFAEAIHAEYPDKMLAYNLSPSFNWDTTGMNDDEMRAFPQEIGKMGFVFNFITYGGHQIDGLAAEEKPDAIVHFAAESHVEILERDAAHMSKHEPVYRLDGTRRRTTETDARKVRVKINRHQICTTLNLFSLRQPTQTWRAPSPPVQRCALKGWKPRSKSAPVWCWTRTFQAPKSSGSWTM